MTWEGGGLGLFMYLLIMEEAGADTLVAWHWVILNLLGYYVFYLRGGQVLRQSFSETHLNLEILITTTAKIQPAGV